MAKTKRENVEFDLAFLTEWNKFCDEQGYTKRQAAHASRFVFMQLTVEEREQFMREAMPLIARKRVRARFRH